jgi:hypothetical protein
MKLSSARRLFQSAFAALLVIAFAPLVRAQDSHDLPPPPPHYKGSVILSRSTDENGQATTQAGPIAQPGAATSAQQATDAERQALTFTAFDMDVRLRTADQLIAVRALLTVRNDGKSPLARIPLQISSSLNWERIRVLNRDTAFAVATLNSDADHTGQLHEAEIPLAVPLAPGQRLQLDVTYSGKIPPNAQRLVAIGTPGDVALHSDWDGIGVDFTGLRGFGNVVWYPVASVPVLLGDGSRLFDQMGQHKLRLAGAAFRLHLTIEFPPGSEPTIVLVNGHPLPLATGSSGDIIRSVNGVAETTLDSSTLGFEAPSLFAAIRNSSAAANTTIWALPQNQDAVVAWAAATTAVTPFLQSWLGQRPRAQLTLLDLPDPQDTPFETGALLATSIRPAEPDQLDGILAHALTHAWMQSPRAWLSEGVAHFMGTLWIEKQSGRTAALQALENDRNALAIAEPSSPGESSGQPLDAAWAPIYYRTKAAYVLWMLRDVAGDAALSAALRAYNPTEDLASTAGRSSFERLLERASLRTDLSWFFADWVDADKGLPDLAVDKVFPAPGEKGSWIVAVDLSNAGYAGAEVPVTVLSDDGSTTRRVLIPARGRITERVLLLNKPTEVKVNDGTVPEVQASLHVTHLDQPTTPTSSPSSSSSTDTPPPPPQ